MTLHAAGDISLGCWTDHQQAKQAPDSGAAGNSPAAALEKAQCSDTAELRDGAKQPSRAAGSGDMDLTNYFAMLPNEVMPFKDLIAPSPVS